MSRDFIDTFDLLDRRSKEFVPCQLYGDIVDVNRRDFTDRWLPIFHRKREELIASGQFNADGHKAFNMQDAYWKWPEKSSAAAASGGTLRSFAVECGGVTQGLMLAAPFGFAKEASQQGRPLVEVLLLSTAPWNRHNLVPSPVYKGVGRIMLTAAITLSLEEDFGGRIGLHALSGAESWYRDGCGMTDLGFDATKNMRYFEMTEAQATKFIS